LDNFEEEEVRNVGKVVRRHNFDSDDDDDDDDDDDEGEEEFDDSQRGCISGHQGRVSTWPGLNHADLISAASEGTAELERDLKAAKDEIKSLKGELEGKRRMHEIMTKLKESPDVAIGDPEYKRLDRDLKGIIRHQVLRIDKMWSDDMALYSEDKNTYCQIISNGIKWPGSISEDEKNRIWKEFLSPRFKRCFGLERNRINQAMMKCFNSELCDVWLARKLHYSYCTISTLSTGDYGSSTYVSANKLQALVSWSMTTEPQEDDVMANIFINFMLKYLQCPQGSSGRSHEGSTAGML
jgi:hypothetical protein